MMFDSLIAYFTHPAFWIALLVIGTLHETGKQLVLGKKQTWPKNGFKGWKGVYCVTRKLHSLILGAIFGLIPGLPVTESLVTEGISGSVMFYMGAGIAAMIGYASVVGTIKDLLANYGKKLANK